MPIKLIESKNWIWLEGQNNEKECVHTSGEPNTGSYAPAMD